MRGYPDLSNEGSIPFIITFVDFARSLGRFADNFECEPSDAVFETIKVSLKTRSIQIHRFCSPANTCKGLSGLQTVHDQARMASTSKLLDHILSNIASLERNDLLDRGVPGGTVDNYQSAPNSDSNSDAGANIGHSIIVEVIFDLLDLVFHGGFSFQEKNKRDEKTQRSRVAAELPFARTRVAAELPFAR